MRARKTGHRVRGRGQRARKAVAREGARAKPGPARGGILGGTLWGTLRGGGGDPPGGNSGEEPRGDPGGSQRGRAGPKSAPWASMPEKPTKFYGFAQGFGTFSIKKCFSSRRLIHLPNHAKNNILRFLASFLLKRYHFCFKSIVRLQSGREVQNSHQNIYMKTLHTSSKVEVRFKIWKNQNLCARLSFSIQSCPGAFAEAENVSLAQGFYVFQILNRASTFYDVYNVFVSFLM